ncbi:glycerophosphodiester phosphodiesterase family protein [Pseudophaeobacter sp.]|uniref:glycerophosphodiester phosphodiesterase family protein n=1 Tax=Pseudophaeobacter sp. TaxID=1971739 RepID=UPI0032998FBB
MIPKLPAEFLSQPVAHRALHDVTDGRPENSRAAIRAAIAAGYAIEIDLQRSSDGCPMVFHDYMLDRLAEARGGIMARSQAELTQIPLKGGDGECIPTLAEVLDLVAGQVPLLIEIKDQDGNLGPNVGALEETTAKELQGYTGTVALMSFNPHATAALARYAPDIARGLVTSSYDPEDWVPVPAETCNRLRDIPDFDSSQSSFISHEVGDLDRSRVQDLRAAGVPILCWTVTSHAAEAEARKWVDNVTFEQYLSPLPA